MKKRTGFLFIMIILVIAGCVTVGDTEGNEDSTEVESAFVEVPSWLMKPPREEGYFFGIGCDYDLKEARGKALVNIGQQFQTKVVSTLVSREYAVGTEGENLINQVDSQLTDCRIVGAKYFDQYQDKADTYWVLARAPVNCVLDIAESVLLSYQLDIQSELPVIEEIIHDLEIEMVEYSDMYYRDSEFSWGTVVVPDGVMHIDGLSDDWNFGPQSLTMLNESIAPERDIHKIFIARDTVNLYVRVEFRGGIPLAKISDLTYDLEFNNQGQHYELWCLKNKFRPLVNITALIGDGWTLDKTKNRQISAGCEVAVGEGFLEAQFPLKVIKGDSMDPIVIQPTFRIRNGGSKTYDMNRLPNLTI